MYKITVSSRGQVVIPLEARKKLKIKEGDILSVHLEDGGRLVIKAIKKEKDKKKIVTKTSGLLADLEMSGLEYVKSIRSGSGRRLDGIEGSY